MAVFSAGTASARSMYQGQPGTTTSILYTAPNYSANVTSPSATAYIKEIVISNITSSAATISILLSPNSTIQGNGSALLWNLSVAANDTKILSGLNTMIPSGGTIQASQGTASSLVLTISGVEVQ